MCRFRNRDLFGDNSYAETEELPKALAAMLVIRLRAHLAVENIENVVLVMTKTKKILANFVAIHSNVKQHSIDLFERVRYVVDGIDNLAVDDRWMASKTMNGSDPMAVVKTCRDLEDILDQIIVLKNLQERFYAKWRNNQTVIEDNFNKFNECFDEINDHKKNANDLMNGKEFFKIRELSISCKIQLNRCRKFGDLCFLWCKESNDLVSDICLKVSRLENAFDLLITN